MNWRSTVVVMLCCLAIISGCGIRDGSASNGAKGSAILKAVPGDVAYVEFTTFVHELPFGEGQGLVIRDRARIAEILTAFQDACVRPGCPGEEWDGAASAPDEFVVHYRKGFAAQSSSFKLHVEDREWGPKVAALYDRLPLKDLHPAQPTDSWLLRAEPVSADRVALYWQAVPGAKGYLVYRADDPAGEDRLITSGAVMPHDKAPGVRNRFLYVDRNLDSTRTYAYRVVAVMPDRKTSSIDVVASPSSSAIPFDTRDPALIMRAALARGTDGVMTYGAGAVEVDVYWVTEPNGTTYTCGPRGRTARAWKPGEDYVDAVEKGRYRP